MMSADLFAALDARQGQDGERSRNAEAASAGRHGPAEAAQARPEGGARGTCPRTAEEPGACTAAAEAAIGTAGAEPDAVASASMPLAARLRPATLDDFIGQAHLLGPDRPLGMALRRGQCHSMILWGPPGVGKTTLALLAARCMAAHLEVLSATSAGVREIREAITTAQRRRSRGQRTVLFIDEVHRFNKAQQDAFLPYIEDGTVVFIGATTENPAFELNRALLSRARVHVLQPLGHDELEHLLGVALTSPRGLGALRLQLADGVSELLISLADGDGRQLLGSLEMLSDMAAPEAGGGALITAEMVRAVAGRRLPRYDKGGDVYYDLISAFHKAVRGSDPQAALYWYARIITAGGDPLYAARRLLALATEDIGLADPAAMTVVLNAHDIFRRVGPAEGERAIAEAAVYCALAPKSNALYRAFGQARRDALELPSYEVPAYLRNYAFGPERGEKGSRLERTVRSRPGARSQLPDGGEGYRYAHDYPHAYAPGECFMPAELRGRVYYTPSDRGLEARLGERMEFLRTLDAQEPQPRFPR